MKILIDNKKFTFGDHRFTYDLYYSVDEKYAASTLGGVFKKVLIEWANALSKITAENSRLFLPFAPDDEGIQCLKATLRDDEIAFAWVEVDESAYMVDFENVEVYSAAPHEIRKESPEFGECSKDQIVSALLNAQVLDE
jgi:hypothetical protein